MKANPELTDEMVCDVLDQTFGGVALISLIDHKILALFDSNPCTEKNVEGACLLTTPMQDLRLKLFSI